MKRNWDKTLFARFEHVGSPSQLVDYLDCPRKWWFRRCVQIPEVKDQKKFVFGNCLSELMKRWRDADDNGRGKDGNPVELYPKGWADGLTPVETALVRLLFEKGVSEGVVRRLHGREAEKEYVREVAPGICSVGALDVTSPEGVEDDKSSKSAKYCLTQDELAADPKMLSYAYEWLDMQLKGPEARWQPSVKLRLNYFIKGWENQKGKKELPAVKFVEAIVPTTKVLEFWEKVAVPAHKGMLELKRARVPEQKWRSVTGPQTKAICKKYNGCPYVRICGGCVTPSGLKAEINRINLKADPKPKTRMSIFSKKPQPAPTPPAPPPTPAPPPAPPSAANPTTNAPWAFDGCGACKGKGINKQGNPCKACYTIRKRRGEPTVDDFETWHDDAGNLCWKSRPLTTKAEVVASIDKQIKAMKQPDPEPAQAPAPAPQAAAPAVEGKAAIVEQPKAKRGRPPKVVEPEIKEAPPPQTEQPAPAPLPATVSGSGGFSLYLNSMPVNRAVVDLADVLSQVGKEMAAEFGVESYYDLDAFKRRDAMAGAAASIAQDLEGSAVVALGGSQDLKALAEALRPFASDIVQGVF